MPAYDSKKFDPPAPVAHVTLRNQETGATWSEVLMLLDFGADVTMIPQAAAGLLGLTVDLDKQYELKGFDGHRSSAPVVQVDIVFERWTFRGQFLLIDQSWGIIGRNILNSVSLVFDGPNLRWDEYRSTR